MPEIKHSFTAGKMNKDLDERLVPNGQYRDAMNIQVRTTAGDGDSDGEGDAGVIQNLQGNSLIGTATGDAAPSTVFPSSNFSSTSFKCVGSIADEKTDRAYFLFTSGGFNLADYSTTTAEMSRVDTIIEHDINSTLNTPVVVDKWMLLTPIINVWNPAADPAVSVPTGSITEFTVVSTLPAKIRENMTVFFYNSANQAQQAGPFKIKQISGTTIRLYDQITATDWSNFTHAKFEHPRVLNFDNDTYITGINIIDNLLFWTDGVTEPKKINIDRCKAGTSADGDEHTKLFVKNINSTSQELENAGDQELSGLNSDLLEEHITVLRPAPTTPPTIDTKTRDLGESKFNVSDFVIYEIDEDGDGIPDSGTLSTWWGSGGTELDSEGFLPVGSVTYIGDLNDALGLTYDLGTCTPELSQVDLRPGDILSVTLEDPEEGVDSCKFKVEFNYYVNPDSINFNPMVNNVATNIIKVTTLTQSNIPIDPQTMQNWSLKVINTEESKFELKFPRFGYRYKYEDGEYSAFSPWSEIAFDPGLFDYDPVKGYNLGMTNTIKKLVIKDFIPYYTDRALDVTDVEILVKFTDSPNIYTLKNIKKIRDGEWELFTPDGTLSNTATQSSIGTGELEIKSEAIHRVLPANQTLRNFDNVPRRALAQDITGSRILYGNIVQGFDLTYPVGLDQKVISESVSDQPKKSIKTIRDYKVGMVFGDKYGRETPVVVSNKIIEDGDNYLAQTDDVVVPKTLCAMANKLSVSQVWDKPGLTSGLPGDMPWMEYVKYYVKETSNEYYNLVLDRWYNAKEEANIWLSFPSVDRNKVDMETYLILKKAHGTKDAVLEKARYKIIDIKSEAPDFIKTDSRVMGRVLIREEDYEVIGVGSADAIQTQEPSELTDPRNTSLTIPAGSWESYLSAYGVNKRGQLYVRIVGVTESAGGTAINTIISGDWKKVNHNVAGTTLIGFQGDGKITYESSFGQSANMPTRFALAGFPIDADGSEGGGVHILKYYLEFKEDVIENKPEFDGRFFVLIEKDLQADEQVLVTSEDTVEYFETDRFTISYVDTQRFNPALNGPYSISGNIGQVTAAGYSSGDAPGIYDGTVDVDSSNDTNYLLDPTQPCEWWGFDKFSSTSPYYFNQDFVFASSGWDGSGYDSRQVTYFALGCDTDFLSSANDGFGSINVNQVSFEGGDDGGVIFLSKTANFARDTYWYWRLFKLFHLAEEQYSNNEYNNKNRIFLDGARANRLMWPEYGTDITTVEEQGESLYGNENYIVSNDSIAEGGPYNIPPSIYNYKPTALDQGHANDGFLGRMTLSQINHNEQVAFAGEGGDGDPAPDAIHTLMTTPGTTFCFVDDDSEQNADGANVPVKYRIIDNSFGTGPDGENEAVGIQQSFGTAKNFGKLNEYGDEGQGYKTMYLASWGATINDLSGTTYNVNFAGENGLCVDENGATVDCFSTLIGVSALVNTAFDTTTEVGFNDAGEGALRVGVKKNIPDDEAKQWASQRRCGQCNSDPGGGYLGSETYASAPEGYAEGDLGSRVSIRFEFRRVDPVTDQVLPGIGLDPTLFDPRGHAKHDGTAGGITIAIMDSSEISGGTAIEIEEDKAVWETEPKEDVDLDLYYEASHALPMVLKQGNTLAFAPLQSKVSIERVSSNPSISPTDDLTLDYFGNRFQDIIVGGVEYLTDDSIIKITSTPLEWDIDSGYYVAQDPALHTAPGIGIGEMMVFEHSSGLKTRSKVEGYYSPPTNPNVTFTPVTSYTTTITLDGAASDDFPEGTISVASGAGFSEADDLVAGMNVSSVPFFSDIPAGIFVTTAEPGVAVALNDTSWMTFGVPVTVTLTQPTGYYKINKNVYLYNVDLGWHNCYSFGNGVESDRIRDDYNAPQIDNGVRVSTTVNEYGQEDRSSSLIFSGLYNTTSGVNDLNEFNMGEKILKDLNPEYGSVQALKTRETDVVAFCEDRILKVQANKEAVFMADNDPNIVATDRVLGHVSTFKGDYGISKNPESLAWDQYRLYFTDTQRGAALRLSMDGLTPISNVGMKSWFRENLKGKNKLLGTFDIVNGEYNLTFSPSTSNGPTISFNEGSKGWVSFKSFAPDSGVSISGAYITVKNDSMFKHYVDTLDSDGNVNNRNLFYNENELTVSSQSSLTVMFNASPGTVKSFKAMNYEGSQARIDQYVDESGNIADDGEYYNIFPDKKGWWVDSFETDLQDGKVFWFVDKENKWFNKISGTQTTPDNLDTQEFTVQGIGSPTAVELPEPEAQTYTFTIENNTDND